MRCGGLSRRLMNQMAAAIRTTHRRRRIMVYRLKMEDAGIVVGKAGQRCALTALQGGMPRQSALLQR